MKQSKTKSFNWYAASQRFSIRTYHFGAASVLLGTALIMGQSDTVKADEVTVPTTLQSATTNLVLDTTESLVSEVPVSVDKSYLLQAVESAQLIDLSTKTALSAEAFTDAFLIAKAVLNHSSVSQDDVNQALSHLNDAMQHLVEKPVVVANDNLLVETADSALRENLPIATTSGSQSVPIAPVAERRATRDARQGQSLTAGTGFRNNVNPVSNILNIEFLDEDNSVLNPNSVFDGKNGQNMTIKVRVTLLENAEDQKVDIILGNFLTFSSRGERDEELARFATISSISSTSELLALNGEKYKSERGVNQTISTGQKVTYTAKAGVTSFTIPLQISGPAQPLVGLKGFSTSGMLDGSSVGIEKTPPITVTIQSTKDGKEIKKTDTFNNVAITLLENTRFENHYNRANLVNYSPSATTDNGYTAVVPIQVGLGRQITNGIGGSYLRNYTETMTHELILPKGVSFMELVPHYLSTTPDDLIWTKISEETSAEGVTTIRFKTDRPSVASQYLLPRLKIDRSVVTGRNVAIRSGNTSVTQRYHTADNPVIGLSSYTIDIFDLTPADDIGLFSLVPGLTNYTVNVLDKPSFEGQYVKLANFDSNLMINNFDSHDSRPKEIYYVFPENPNFKVKGINIPAVTHEGEVNAVGYIRVKTKQTNTWKTITFNEPIVGSNLKSMKDVVALGFEPDDVLTEVAVPVGVFKANASYTWPNSGIYGFAHIYGIMKNPPVGVFDVAEVTLRDEGYDPTIPSKNQTNGTGRLRGRLADTIGYTEVIPPSSVTIPYANKGVVDFTIRTNSGLGYINNQSEEIKALHLILPNSVDVSAVRFFSGTKELTSSVIALSKVENGANNHYVFDFSEMGDERFIGTVAKAGQPHTSQSLSVRVEIANNVDKTTIIPLDQVIFVETVEPRNRIGHNTRQADPYNLVVDDKTLYTNGTVTSNRILTLTRTERLDLTSEAKLSTEVTFREANTNFQILSIDEDLDFKLNIANNLTTEVGEIDLFLPIPKQGQNWGSNFQTKAFDFGLSLNALTADEQFSKAVDISYYSVPAEKLNGVPLTIQELSEELAQVAYTKDTNLIRIKSKQGVKVPASTNLSITMRLGLLDIATEQDGRNITWNPYYVANYTKGSAVDKARQITMSVARGKLGFIFFNDGNATGQFEDSETAFTGELPTYEIYDSENNLLDLTELLTASRGGQVVSGLTSAQTYTIRAKAPAGYRFTTGTVVADTTSHTMTATLSNLVDTQLTPVGLTPILTLVKPDLTSVNDVTAVTPSEQTQVNNKVKAKNPGLPEGTSVTTDNKGKVTVRYPDGFTEEINPVDTVRQAEISAPPIINRIDSDDTGVTGTGVPGAVVAVQLPGETSSRSITVTADGSWEITLLAPLPAGQTITVTQTEPDKKVSPRANSVVEQTEAQKNPLNLPEWTVVDDTQALTPQEQEAVRLAVSVKNPGLQTSQIVVTDKGAVAVTYPDGSGNGLTPDQTITLREMSSKPIINRIDSDDTGVTGTGVPGSKIEVTLPDGSLVSVTVSAEGTWSLSLPSPLPAGTTITAVQIEPAKKPSAPSTIFVVATLADTISPNLPVKTVVDDLTELTDEEKKEVKAAIEQANPGFPAGTEILVGSDGSTTITYPDGSIDQLTSTDIVVLRATSATPVITKVDTDDTGVTGTGVPGSKVNLTLPDGSLVSVTVSAEGTWILSLPSPLPAGAAITAVQIEPAKKPSAPSTILVVATLADTISPNLPVKTVVDDLTQLTDEEKKEVKEAIEQANPGFPAGTEILIGSDGSTTITYSDASIDRLTSTDTVVLRATSATPVITKVDTDDTGVTGTGVPGSKVTITLPDGSLVSVTVSAEGTWILSLPSPLPAGAAITAVQIEPAKKPSAPSTILVVATLADTISPKLPVKTVVDYLTELTDEEKKEVKAAIEKANPGFPAGTEILVGSDGSTTITYPDGSIDQLTSTDTVVLRATSTTPVINEVDSDDTHVTGTGVPGATVVIVFPNGEKKSAVVGSDGTWVVATNFLPVGSTVKASQTELGKKPSGEVASSVLRAPDKLLVTDKKALVEQVASESSNRAINQLTTQTETTTSLPTQKASLPNTGDSSSATTLIGLATMMVGLSVMTVKRIKED